MKKLLNGELVDMTEQEIQIRNSDIEKNKVSAQEEKALYDAEQANRTSGKAKLKTGEALTDAEVEALFG
jgi:hypothetical protein